MVHFAIQAFPTQCSDDTSNYLTNSVFKNVSTCAVPVTQGYNATMHMSACPVSGVVNYTFMYSVNGGMPILGDTFNCVGFTGNTTVMFFIDNGVCPQEFSTTINCTGVGLPELEAENVILYPNPAIETLKIKFSGTVIISKMEVVDIAGRIVMNMFDHETLASEFSVPVQALMKGTYFVRLTDGSGQTIVKRFLKM